MENSLQPSHEKHEITFLRPSRGLRNIDLRELWVYRELIYFLTWRDLKVRYKQTALGAAWAILQPFLSMVVFSIFFGNLLNVPSSGVPYPIFSYTALLPWGLFSNALSDAGRSLVTNRAMITKIYFPRMAIPLSSVLSGLVDFAIAFVVLLGMLVYFDISLTLRILTLPFLLLLALVTALGVGLWLSALNVVYRDVGYIIPFLTQFWFYATPIVYSVEIIPEKWRTLYALNPMVGVVTGFRWALLDIGSAPGPVIAVSALISLVILISGLFYFRRMEKIFADIV
jgi:homopolymeric O-antigen transport system permease protein